MVDAKLCPICGLPNDCATALGRSETCWCCSVQIPQSLLDRIPDEARRKACVCQTCVKKAVEKESLG